MNGREVHLVAYPRGDVRASDFRVVEAPVPEPGAGAVLVRNTWTSIDAALRLRLRERAPAGYFASFPLGAPMAGSRQSARSSSRGRRASRAATSSAHGAGWREYAVVEAGQASLGGVATLARLDTDAAPPEAYLGPLGGSGLTAYAGLFHVAGLGGGDVVWVSAAAGSVGSLAAQMAKLRGHRVIGSAGSAEKIAYLLGELGLDAAFDYKRGRCRTSCATPRRTASTSTSTTSAAATSRRRSARCANGGALRSAARSPSTRRPSRSRGRRTCSSPSRTTSRCAGSAARATST